MRVHAHTFVAALFAGCAAAVPQFVNYIKVSGDATDLFKSATGVNGNRLGGFGSDFYYDAARNEWYGVADRGPGGGTISYEDRIQNFDIDIDGQTGAISNFRIRRTIPLKDGERPLNGLNPLLLNGDASVLGLSFDPEGIVVGRYGTYFVSDEYGASVVEFDRTGQLLRRFDIPPNVLPRNNNTGKVDFVSSAAALSSGRQSNRGYEGFAISPDGSTLFALLQDPLIQDGTGAAPSNRFSRNSRIIKFDAKTGRALAQYVYQVDLVSDINTRLVNRGINNGNFSASAQGNNIHCSAMKALSENTILVLEKDNRGLGVGTDSKLGLVAHKRVYLINLQGATDVTGRVLSGNNDNPGVVPVTKTLFLDILAAFQANNVIPPEKLEALTIGPKLNDGRFLLLLGSDNDFSVTQNADGVQFDWCVQVVNSTYFNQNQTDLGTPCPAGYELVPSFLYAFAVNASELGDYQPQIREDARLSIRPERVYAQDCGSNQGKTVTLDVVLSRPLTYDVTVSCRTLDDEGDALPGRDYESSSQLITIRAGETSSKCSIKVYDAQPAGAPRSLYVGLLEPTAGAVVTPTESLTEVVIGQGGQGHGNDHYPEEEEEGEDEDNYGYGYPPKKKQLALEYKVPASVKCGKDATLKLKIKNTWGKTVQDILVELLVPSEKYVSLDSKHFKPKPQNMHDGVYRYKPFMLKAGKYITLEIPFEVRSNAKGGKLRFEARVSVDDENVINKRINVRVLKSS